MDKNDKATQPSGTLNLDKLTRYDLYAPVEGQASMDVSKDGEYVEFDAVATLIAQARAAQPESATAASQEETTGAIVKTWQERSEGSKDINRIVDAMEAEIADRRNEVTNLRAQLAARGRGNRLLPRESFATDEAYSDYLLEWAAPASAQPDRGAVQDDERALFEITLADELKKDQGEFAMSRAYSEGNPYTFLATKWAYRAWQAARAASPASQPVAPEVWRWISQRDLDWLERNKPDTDANPAIPLHRTGGPTRVALYLAAVAPSDAKGKEDAANARGRWVTKSNGNSHWEPATSAADAKDAALREARDGLTNCIAFIEDAHVIDAQWHWEPVATAKAAIAAIDAAMTAAPSNTTK